ncbi:MAG: type I DNA topoisomerase [Campylobacteraceae bacterium]|nr:type I DNA topoisomerase [Campylobacteraceae bacterium]
MKSLIIVESPTKAKTISGFLDDGKKDKSYQVIASKGHVRDLPKNSFGIKIEQDSFIPEYKIAKEHSKIVKEIKELAQKSDEVFIATDEDREGEAIGFHIATAIGKKPESLPRIAFHEITKTAILNSLKNPRKIDINSVNAQQTRRLLDRIVGYKLSPLLGLKIQKGLSAGRVQSAALKIVVDKEREIRAFNKEEYWTIDGVFKKDVKALLVEFKDNKIEKMSIKNEAEALKIKETLKDDNFIVASIEKKNRTSAPQPPFMTSTLQQAASSLLGFSPKKTMNIAQKLYEGVTTHNGTSGVITYMRTDSLNISKEAIEESRKEILKTYGKDYLPEKARFYATKSKSAQEAHEAIRPTIIDFSPNIAKKYLDSDEFKLYALIYNRFLASQMTNAVFESQNVMFASDNSKFKANGRKLIFDGFYIVYGESDKNTLLPNLKEGENIEAKELEANQHFTEPPSRYSEASLINKLESLGIGRPSTYAPTISILVSRDYINIEKKQLIPTEIAFTVTKMLEDNFPNIVDSNFTSLMEDTLDLVAEGKKDWQMVLMEFYTPFDEKVTRGKKEIQSVKVATPTGEKCPECGSELVLRKGRFGEFVACSSYPKCKYTKNISATLKAEPIKLSVKCPECDGDIIERKSKKGKFFGCSNYPKCKFISNNEPINQKCPECGYILVKKILKKGEQLECLKCKHKVDKEQ